MEGSLVKNIFYYHNILQIPHKNEWGERVATPEHRVGMEAFTGVGREGKGGMAGKLRVKAKRYKKSREHPLIAWLGHF